MNDTVEFDPIKDISAIQSLVERVRRQVDNINRNVGDILFDQTMGVMIHPTLDQIDQRLRDLQGAIVEDKIRGAWEASNNMLNAALAGAAIADPSQAPILAPLLQPTRLEN